MKTGSDEERTNGGPIAALAELRQVTPPPALVARVMSAVATPRPWTIGQALSRLLHAELRLSVRTAVLLAAGMGVVAWAERRPSLPLTPLTPLTSPTAPIAAAPSPNASQAAAAPPILVRFVFEDRHAHQVFVAGSFNDWNPTALSPDDDEDGARASRFVATLSVPRGLHEYMFLVDGQWVRDPLVSDSRPDGFGRQNSLLRL